MCVAMCVSSCCRVHRCKWGLMSGICMVIAVSAAPSFPAPREQKTSCNRQTTWRNAGFWPPGSSRQKGPRAHCSLHVGGSVTVKNVESGYDCIE